jgi:hypothetical protein
MTRARYKTEVKLFALNERAEGKGWQVIRQRIAERFNVPPPTVRAMEKWQKSLNRETIAAELMKDAKREGPRIQAQAQMTVAQNLLPVLFAARDAGQDMEAAAWKWFFNWIEGWLGREKFERMIREYLSERKGI